MRCRQITDPWDNEYSCHHVLSLSAGYVPATSLNLQILMHGERRVRYEIRTRQFGLSCYNLPMASYGQFCSVARAHEPDVPPLGARELLAERGAPTG